MYPSTTIEIVDQSQYTKTVSSPINTAPTFMVGFASDKGTEDFTLWQGPVAWHQMFGYSTSFKKYGQALKQAAQVIDNGGKLYCKRVVAPDATLANSMVYAEITKTTETILYDDDGNVSGTTGETAIHIKYGSVTVNTNKNNMEQVAGIAETLLPESTNNKIVLPLFLIAGSGRGSWTPRFRITPDYRSSRTFGYVKYLFEVIDSDDPDTESFYFSTNPNIVERNKSTALDMVADSNSNKIRCVLWEENFDSLYDMIETHLGFAEGYMRDLDLLFGKDLRGNAIDGIHIDSSAFDLQNVYGNPLNGGSDGSFGNAPLQSTVYTSELVKLFNGIYSEEIYNLSNISIDLIVDADYPVSVKRAIEEFVTYRTDAFFMRDMGLNVENLLDIAETERNVLHNRYSSSYCNSMDVIDDDTFKWINVTICYLFIPKLINHFINGRNRPFAGLRYGIYWGYGSDIKKGSINIIPRVTPGIDEKQTLDDLGVNFVSIYQGNNVVLETLYTSQHVNMTSQLSFSCNVWAIQEVIKILRARCPIIRYSFATGNDLEEYQSDLDNVLSGVKNDFMSFAISYEQDTSYTNQKIYYATLEVTFNDFYQSESFKIVALPTT